MQPRRTRTSLSTVLLCALGVLCGCFSYVSRARAADPLPMLTAPVNDFARVIDASSADAMERMIRELQSKTGDVVTVATVQTVEPYADVHEYAVKLFENNGRGIGVKGKDNGLLILLALKERRVWVEVGYGLEEWITDGFAGETSRELMTPEFRNGRYGAGLLAGTERIIGRIAQGRNVTLDGVRAPRVFERSPDGMPIPIWVIILIFIAIMIIGRLSGGPRRQRRYWGGPWSGWSSGVGPFGGGWGGGFGGGGGGFSSGGSGGGFGGFGGGRSGGGGGGAGW